MATGSTNSDGVYVYGGDDAPPGGLFHNLLNLLTTAITTLLGWRGRTFRGTAANMVAFKTNGLAQEGDRWFCTNTATVSGTDYVAGVTYRYSSAGTWLAWDSEWATYAPTLTSGGAGALGTVSSLAFRYKWVGGSLQISGSASVAAGTATDNINVPLPTGVTAGQHAVAEAANVSANTQGSLRISSGQTAFAYRRYDGAFPVTGTQTIRLFAVVPVN